MKNSLSKGMSQANIIIVVIILIVAALGIYFVTTNGSPAENDEMMEDGEAMMEDNHDAGDSGSMEEEGTMMEEGGSMENTENPAMEEGGAMESDEGAMMELGDDSMMEGSVNYEGEVLAGNSSPLLVFNQSDYDKALQNEKVVVLYFYANWCPICRAEFPKMEAAFDDLNSDQVVGFRVNYNDNETNDNEKALAKEFGVAYQHTKIVLVNGERTLKSPEGWEKSRYLEEITSALEK